MIPSYTCEAGGQPEFSGLQWAEWLDFLLAPSVRWAKVALMRAGLFLGLFFLAGVLRAEEEKIDENLLKLFDARVYREASAGSLPYRLYKPANYDPAQKYPLVLFLQCGR